MTRNFIDLRGLDKFMMDLILEPESVHQLMRFLTDGYLKRLDFLESSALLSLNTGGSYVGSGGFGWTDQLPDEKNHHANVKTQDMWGFCESQETVGVSPEMFNEFILPYQMKILNRFGLNCYGCCEPIDVRWEYVKTIPNLRRISTSPWADVSKMKEYLGSDYIMSIKPYPTPLASKVMDEKSARNELRDALNHSKGCVVELIMKDNHTLGGNPDNIVKWVKIARQEIDRL